MTDGISQGYRNAEANEKWENETVPWIRQNLLGKKPEEMTPRENHLMYAYIKYVSGIASNRIYSWFQTASSDFWDAYLGQGDFKHFTRKGITKVKRLTKDRNCLT